MKFVVYTLLPKLTLWDTTLLPRSGVGALRTILLQLFFGCPNPPRIQPDEIRLT